MTTRKTSRSVAPPRTRSITIRLPTKLLQHFEANGAGYQTRIREALEQHVEREHRLASFDKACKRLKGLSARARSALSLIERRPLNVVDARDPFDAIPD